MLDYVYSGYKHTKSEILCYFFRFVDFWYWFKIIWLLVFINVLNISWHIDINYILLNMIISFADWADSSILLIPPVQ